ncbi:HNH endonuclease [Streptomyces longwoodensis]|uniref:HNH endonuclease signature motif containing protein n=1 Tax=Streptomyces longwoodensis TaxID=68231 RepID=UPI0036872ACA
MSLDLSDKATRRRVNKRFRERGIPAKVCGKCFVVKGHAAFHAHRKATDGRAHDCKACACARTRQWTADNPERKAATDAAYRATHHDALSTRSREYYTRNRDRIAEYSAAYYRENKDRHRERNRRWVRENPERFAAIQRRYRSANPGKAVVRAQKRRAIKAEATVTPFTARDLRHDWEDHDLWSCFFCGGSLTDAFDVEHFYPLVPDDEDAEPGPHALFNLVPSCPACNRGRDGKHSKEPWQFLRESLAEQGTDLDACLEFLAGRRR